MKARIIMKASNQTVRDSDRPAMACFSLRRPVYRISQGCRLGQAICRGMSCIDGARIPEPIVGRNIVDCARYRRWDCIEGPLVDAGYSSAGACWVLQLTAMLAVGGDLDLAPGVHLERRSKHERIRIATTVHVPSRSAMDGPIGSRRPDVRNKAGHRIRPSEIFRCAGSKSEITYITDTLRRYLVWQHPLL